MTVELAELMELVREKYCTQQEALAELGIGRSTLWRWISAGKIESYELGREILFEKDKVEQLKGQRYKR